MYHTLSKRYADTTYHSITRNRTIKWEGDLESRFIGTSRNIVGEPI